MTADGSALPRRQQEADAAGAALVRGRFLRAQQRARMAANRRRVSRPLLRMAAVFNRPRANSGGGAVGAGAASTQPAGHGRKQTPGRREPKAGAVAIRNR